MRIEIEFPGGDRAAIEGGEWKCTNKALLPSIRAVSGTVEDSPSIPDLDRARALIVAQVLCGRVMTNESEAAGPDRVY